MADDMEVKTPNGTTLERTIPDYEALSNLMKDLEAELPPPQGPYSSHMRPEGCLVNLLLARYYIRKYNEGLAAEPNVQQSYQMLQAYMVGRWGRSAVEAVETRYKETFARHHSGARWEVDDWIVARHLTEIALTDLHFEDTPENVCSLLYVATDLCGLGVQFDPSSENPLIRTLFDEEYDESDSSGDEVVVTVNER